MTRIGEKMYALITCAATVGFSVSRPCKFFHSLLVCGSNRFMSGVVWCTWNETRLSFLGCIFNTRFSFSFFAVGCFGVLQTNTVKKKMGKEVHVSVGYCSDPVSGALGFGKGTLYVLGDILPGCCCGDLLPKRKMDVCFSVFHNQKLCL